MTRSIQEMSLAELQTAVHRLRYIYYNTDRSTFPNESYEAMLCQLRQLDPTNPALTSVGAPADRSNHLAKIKHKAHMGSIANAMNNEELLSWWTRVNPVSMVMVSYKVDGLSCLITYNEGVLVSVATRGDGKVGDDITANARLAKGLPHRLPKFPTATGMIEFTGTIRAELVLTIEDWKRLDPDETMVPRNFASGLARRKSNTDDCQYLSVVAHGIDRQGDVGAFWRDRFAALEFLGFTTPHPVVISSAADVDQYFGRVQTIRSELPYEIDGLVVTTDNLKQFMELGIDGENCPRGQIAYKFPPQTAESVLLAVEVNVGHTGALNPRAIFKPVLVGGVSIQHATLSNFNEIVRLGLKIGDGIEISRQGDTIPKVLRVTKSHPTGAAIHEPTMCPVCGSPAQRECLDDGPPPVFSAHIYCQGSDCPAQAVGKLERWIRSLDIKEIGPALRRALMDDFVFTHNGQPRMFSNFVDLYRLTLDELAKLPYPAREGPEDLPGKPFGKVRAKRVMDQIDKARTLTISQVVGSLGVKHLGKGRAENIQEAGDRIESQRGILRTDLFAWLTQSATGGGSVSYLLKHADALGIPEMAFDIQAGLDARRTQLEELTAPDVNIKITFDEVKPQVTNGRLSGKSFCFTQVRMTDAEEARLSELGGENRSGVSKGLTYLVTKDPTKATAKSTKAAALGTQVISYAEFQKLIL